jgi:hypothetical protein
MELKYFIPLIAVIILVSGCNATLVTTTITTDGTYFNVPSDVYSITSLTLYPAGGSGGAGGLITKYSDAGIYLRYNGPGGLVGSPVTYNNIPVTPGSSILFHIGQPGGSPPGYYGVCPDSGTSTFNVPSASYTGYNGGNTYTTIGGTTYSSTGGDTGRITIQCTSGVPSISTTNNYNNAGQTGFLTSSTFAQPGSPTTTGGTLYSAGGYAGQGYSAGGGGGGLGWDATQATGGAGGGGAGAPGIAVITYSTSTVQPYSPSGYVMNYTGTAISGATVTVTQLLNTVSATTDATGYYSIASSANFISNVVVNMTITKSGYSTDINKFTPLSYNTLVNRTLIAANKTCSPPCIYGVTGQYWTNSTIPSANVYLRINGTSVSPTTTISTAGGFYEFDGLSKGVTYDVWSQKTGFGNSSVAPITVTG